MHEQQLAKWVQVRMTATDPIIIGTCERGIAYARREIARYTNQLEEK